MGENWLFTRLWRCIRIEKLFWLQWLPDTRRRHAKTAEAPTP
jgi:hypothetical protein